MNDAPAKTYRLLGRDGLFFDSAVKGELGGQRRTKVYGRLRRPQHVDQLITGQSLRSREHERSEHRAALATAQIGRHDAASYDCGELAAEADRRSLHCVCPRYGEIVSSRFHKVKRSPATPRRCE